MTSTYVTLNVFTTIRVQYNVRVLQCVNSDVEIPIYLSGRFKKISRTERLCNLCDDWVVGDEFHYILKCKALCIERKRYIQEIYINKPSIAVMHKLFNSCDVKILSKIMVKFIIIIINANFALVCMCVVYFVYYQ